MTLGDFELLSLSDGFFRLDGGAMFGVVPKPLWERRAPADERNRIRLGLRPLLVRTDGANVLIDAGVGHATDRIMGNVEAAGVEPKSLYAKIFGLVEEILVLAWNHFVKGSRL